MLNSVDITPIIKQFIDHKAMYNQYPYNSLKERSSENSLNMLFWVCLLHTTFCKCWWVELSKYPFRITRFSIDWFSSGQKVSDAVVGNKRISSHNCLLCNLFYSRYLKRKDENTKRYTQRQQLHLSNYTFSLIVCTSKLY